jgi:hypothetical protein
VQAVRRRSSLRAQSFGRVSIQQGARMDDDYDVKLKGLSEGVHHLKFEGELPAFGFSLSVDYLLTVVKVRLSD